MSTTNINVRADNDLKQSAEDLFKDLGLSISSAITMFLKSAFSHDDIPFEIKAALAEYEEIKKNPSNYTRYDSFDELLDETLKDA